MVGAAPVKRKPACKKKVGKSVVRKHPKQPCVGRALSLEVDLTLFVQLPQNVHKKKRNPRLHTSGQSRINPGSILLGTGGKSGTFSTHSFPEELVEEILSRLSVKCLARFSCVSKSWYHLIHSEGFASLHMNNFKTSHLLLCSGDASRKECSLSFIPAPPLNDAASQKVVKAYPATLGGSCNGIVCLYRKYAGNIALWNPATKDFKNIPKSDIPRQYGLDPLFVTIGFGFDPKKNDYKILQMACVDHRNAIQLEVYSLRKNSWRKINSHDFVFHVRFWTSDLVCNIPSTEYKVICALIKPLLSPTKWEILSFDVSTEMFDIIEISSSLEAELSNGGDKCIKLFPFNGSLALSNNHNGSQTQITNLWVLNNFTESSRSWSKLFYVEVDIGPRIIGSWENDILFYDRGIEKLSRFDLGKHEVTEVVSWPGGMTTSTIYGESLVRVSQENEIKEGKRLRNKKRKTICKEGMLSIRPPSWRFY